MSNEQKLREALQLCRAALDNLGLAATLRKDAMRAADEALATTEPVMANGLTEAETDASASVVGLATTEPEPTGMPPAPEPDIHYIYIGLGWKPATAQQYAETHRQKCAMHSTIQLQTYGEQCWKAGYKHGAWGDKPAVNQQLTTEPFDEREAFEKWITKNGEWPNNAVRSCFDEDEYANFTVQGLWEAWQARAAMAKGVK